MAYTHENSLILKRVGGKKQQHEWILTLFKRIKIKIEEEDV